MTLWHLPSRISSCLAQCFQLVGRVGYNGHGLIISVWIRPLDCVFLMSTAYPSRAAHPNIQKAGEKLDDSLVDPIHPRTYASVLR